MSTLTPKGNELLGVIQKVLESKGDDSQVTVEEIAEFGDMSIPSVRGRMNKLVKDGYITSKAVEVEEGKKRKHITLTSLGWEVDTDAYTPPSEDAE